MSRAERLIPRLISAIRVWLPQQEGPKASSSARAVPVARRLSRPISFYVYVNGYQNLVDGVKRRRAQSGTARRPWASQAKQAQTQLGQLASKRCRISGLDLHRRLAGRPRRICPCIAALAWLVTNWSSSRRAASPQQPGRLDPAGARHRYPALASRHGCRGQRVLPRGRVELLASFSQAGMSGLLDERRGRRGPVKLRPEIMK